MWDARQGLEAAGHAGLSHNARSPRTSNTYGRLLLDLGWTAGRVRALTPGTGLLDGLAVLNGQCTCPLCARTFSLYEGALALLE